MATQSARSISCEQLSASQEHHQSSTYTGELTSAPTSAKTAEHGVKPQDRSEERLQGPIVPRPISADAANTGAFQKKMPRSGALCALPPTSPVPPALPPPPPGASLPPTPQVPPHPFGACPLANIAEVVGILTKTLRSSKGAPKQRLGCSCGATASIVQRQKSAELQSPAWQNFPLLAGSCQHSVFSGLFRRVSWHRPPQ